MINSDMEDYVFVTPDHKRDPTIPTTAEATKALKKCVEMSDPEYAKQNELGIYSKSARKEREERLKIPKTPKLPVKFLLVSFKKNDKMSVTLFIDFEFWIKTRRKK